MTLNYRNTALGSTPDPDPALVRALQTDLRTLGYLARLIDGQFGEGTRRAVRRLQFDLLRNDGRSSAGDGPAAVAMTAYNRGVESVTGIVDAALADSIEALLSEARIPQLPQSDDPRAANRTALMSLSAAASAVAPTPYILAIFQQESGGQHYAVPQSKQDTDSFITLGLDTNGATEDQVTSRGYGLGQYTIFHHPPRPEEVADFVVDPIRNAQKAFQELRDKFDNFVISNDARSRADDREAEHPILALRLCRYKPADARFLSACRDCARQARKVDIGPATTVYHGATQTYGDAKHYTNASYVGVPDRADIQCDWPYAVRRYNGGGPDSFNYQARILLNLLAGPIAGIGAVA